MSISIRAAKDLDRDFLFDQAGRLAAVAKLPWHSEQDLLAFQHRYMTASFALEASKVATYIAEDTAGAPLGFVHVEASTDTVTLEPCAYVTVLAVTAEAEGRGVAARLMTEAESWARAKGFRLICLDVFANNDRACAFYRRKGYQDDSLRLTKTLEPER